ncbi:unnamed protein product [Larinioides sclopetarius]|uniref:Uncharacterized protein n=1 Tax=Larinioides sclopetarius TaxID=280406 RepID=A0AAV2AID4_9ARAC
MSSLVASQMPKNSASIDDKVTHRCFAVLHETGALPQKTMYPLTEIRSSLEEAKSASE